MITDLIAKLSKFAHPTLPNAIGLWPRYAIALYFKIREKPPKSMVENPWQPLSTLAN
ncbi:MULTISPECIES: hypothetical protein [unclassified Moorena]|uniref:hypothetical protein n=1 Tax=unclassified Moorena TaxID=2683338 RepID=UPI0014015E4B|nr:MULTISPECIES: hypothetical protein [unclassified Moorena]NEO16986.1 hypothetical protein [Moorena sp. SIO3E8]NEQ03587.1 hypothetical protein [Moorena sp. SIO3F7]